MAMKLPVINFDLHDEKKSEKRHSAILPNTIRAIFCGPSGCGKSNALLSLIIHPNGLKFENIYIYSKTLHQPKYKFLENVIEYIEGLDYHPFSDHEEVVKPEDAKPNSIMIFDDVACEKQDNIRAFFSMGRHCNVDSFYLCQTYTRIPKHLVRDNANFLVIFAQDDMNLRHVYSDHVNTDMTLKQFHDLCSQCWKDKHGFLVIDKESDMNDGRCRKKFDQFLKI